MAALAGQSAPPPRSRRRSMAHPAFQKLKDTNALPSPTGVALELLRLTSGDDAPIDAIIAAVESDPALAARVLKLVNSAFAAVPRRVAAVSSRSGYWGRGRSRTWRWGCRCYRTTEAEAAGRLSTRRFGRNRWRGRLLRGGLQLTGRIFRPMTRSRWACSARSGASRWRPRSPRSTRAYWTSWVIAPGRKHGRWSTRRLGSTTTSSPPR